MGGLYSYECRVKFNSKAADEKTIRIYNKVLEDYKATASEADEEGISTLFIVLDKPLLIGTLKKDLEKIPLISSKEINLE